MEDAEELNEARNHLGLAVGLGAESIGPPGQRTFRLLVDGARAKAVLWVEKEQLYQLGVAIKRLLATTDETQGSEPPSGWPSVEGTFDFKVGRMTLGHDGESGLFLFLAQEVDAEDQVATVAWWADRRQVDSLADEAFGVVAAGRPLCILCGAPTEPEPHICPRHNGHALI
ncbi:MAG: DUF3090 family protein [Chloroflexi bacterium]|nr:DUF3090 family protein [Chloroflexota bacterium]